MPALALSLVKFSSGKPDAPAHTHPKQSVPTKMLSLLPVSKHGVLQIFERTKKKKNPTMIYDLIVLLCCLCFKRGLMLAFVLGTKSARQMGSFGAWKECGGMRTVPHLSLQSALGEKATTA